MEILELHDLIQKAKEYAIKNKMNSAVVIYHDWEKPVVTLIYIHSNIWTLIEVITHDEDFKLNYIEDNSEVGRIQIEIDSRTDVDKVTIENYNELNLSLDQDFINDSIFEIHNIGKYYERKGSDNKLLEHIKAETSRRGKEMYKVESRQLKLEKLTRD